MKKTLKTLIAVILAAAMLTSCGAKTEDVSADLGNNLTRAADAADTTEKAETTKTADSSETTAAETTAQAETTTTAPEEEEGLPIKIYSAVCNDPLQDILSKYYDGIVYLTSDNKLYYNEDEIFELKDASSGNLVDTDVRDIVSCNGTCYYVKNDNTVWAFGENEDERLGPKLMGKDSSGYDVELEYIPYDQPIQVLDNVANIYSFGFYEMCYLDYEKNVKVFTGKTKPKRTIAENVVEFAMYPKETYSYSYLTADGEFYSGGLDLMTATETEYRG
ncbi:MAG: hypothetical protein LBL87_05050 [Ruminococcus sp.]|jgi:hypothetical protein|nr:hypothetical protein [Ruminococcus sp.]